ncbi:site-specific integrase [Salmonella enterica]|nr:site-specific integrase [Salmonella enterica]
MGKLTEVQIKAWIKRGERFEGRTDGNGLYLRYRDSDKSPVWRYRYKFAGKPRIMMIGTYPVLSLAQARTRVKELAAEVTLGKDVASEKQKLKAETLAEITRKEDVVTLSAVALEFWESRIKPRWKTPEPVRGLIVGKINPVIGHLPVEEVNQRHIEKLLRQLVDNGTPTVANSVLRLLRRILRHARKMQLRTDNPAMELDISDAGGREKIRKRWLSKEELIVFFRAMRKARGFSRENELALRLLLVLCCRKMELCGAPWVEFDLDNAVWHMGRGQRYNSRTGEEQEWTPKNGEAIDIPLPPQAVTWLRELRLLAGGSQWVFPARKMQHLMTPHIHDSTLPTALAKVRTEMKGIPPFTVHDIRRTGRTHLSMLGVDFVVAERCINHSIKGVAQRYDHHDYFDERRAGLTKWADWLEALENGENPE